MGRERENKTFISLAQVANRVMYMFLLVDVLEKIKKENCPCKHKTP